MQAQVEEVAFMFNLEYRLEAIPHGFSKNSQCPIEPKNPCEMSETQ
jgi:hypothetical protein